MKMKRKGKGFLLYPEQQKVWDTKKNMSYDGAPLSWGVTDGRLLNSLVNGFAAIGKGILAIFTFGQSIEIETPDYLHRTNEELL